MTAKIKIKKPKTTLLIAGVTDTVHYIPAGSTEKSGMKLDLALLDGWDQLSSDKQRFLLEYSKNDMAFTHAALTLNKSSETIKRWLAKDELFARLKNEVDQIHIECIERVQYQVAYNKTKGVASRNKFLEAHSEKYKTKTPEFNQNNLFVTGRENLAQLQQMFQKRQNEESKTAKLTDKNEIVQDS